CRHLNLMKEILNAIVQSLYLSKSTLCEDKKQDKIVCLLHSYLFKTLVISVLKIGMLLHSVVNPYSITSAAGLKPNSMPDRLRSNNLPMFGLYKHQEVLLMYSLPEIYSIEWNSKPG